MNIKFFWNKDLANIIAKKEGLLMSNIHWLVIIYFRCYFFKNKSLPNNRILLSYLNKTFMLKKFNSIDLYKLFPKGLFKQVCLIGNLPKNINCF